MPDKKGRFTLQEQTFVAALAHTGSRAAAAKAARYKSTGAVAKANDPRIMAAVEAERRRILQDELLPLAVQAHKELLGPGTPAATRATAVKLAYDEWSKLTGDRGEGADPSEMTPEELAARIAMLEVAAAAKAVDVTEASSVLD